MSLYKVTVEYTLVVEADDEREARSLAKRRTDREIPDAAIAYPIRERKHVPPHWMGCIPWGTDDDRTVEERIEGEEVE